MDLLRVAALCINFEKGRSDSRKDLNLFTKTLEQELGANVTSNNFEENPDNPVAAVKDVMDRFIAGKNFEEVDCVVVSLFCHGDMDEVFEVGKTRKQLQKALLDGIFQIEALRGKLVWAVLQLCSGPYDCHLAEPDSPAKEKVILPYFVKSFASREGSTSFRFEGEGAPFIKHLCANLKKYKRDRDLLSILDAMREGVAEEYRKRMPNNTEFPEPRDKHNLPCPFYFTRGFVKPSE